MPRRTSNFDGVTRADERIGYALNSLRNAIAGASNSTGTTGSGGVSFPIPYFPAQGGTTFYWQADNSSVSAVPDPSDPTNPGSNIPVDDYNLGTDEDNEDGGTMVTWWLIPNDCATLGMHGRYVKKNGRYGRDVIPFEFNDITDEERGMGFCERTLRGLRPGRVLDITRAVSISTSGAKAHNPVEPAKAAMVAPQITSGATRDTSMQAWPNPVGGSPAIGYPPYGVSPHYPLYQNPALPASQGEALARLDLRNYALLQPRITAVGAAEKEGDAIYFPLTITYAAGLVDALGLWFARAGRKVAGSIDYSKYGQLHRMPLARLTPSERTAGTCVRRFGPLNEHQARQIWHILRVRAVDFRDDVQSKRYREFWPTNEIDTAGPDDLVPGLAPSHSTSLQSSYQIGAQWSAAPVPGAATSSGAVDVDDIPAAEQTAFQNAAFVNTATNAGRRRVLAVIQPVQAVAGQLTGFTVTSQPDLETEKDGDAWVEFNATIRNEANTATITAGEAHATEAVCKWVRQADYATYNASPAANKNLLHRKRVDLDANETTVTVRPPDKKIGRKLHMVECVLRNAISKVKTDLRSQTGGGLTSGQFVVGFASPSGGNYVDTDANLYASVAIVGVDDSGESNQIRVLVQIQNLGNGGLGVIPKRGHLYKTTRATTSAPFSGPSSTLNPSSPWKNAKDVKLVTDHELAAVGTYTIQIEVPMRRKRATWFWFRLFVKGSPTPIDVAGAYGPVTPDSELPNNNYAHGNGNQVVGGSFLFSRKDFGTTDAPHDDKLGKHWYSTPQKNTNYITTVSNPRWDPSRHCLRFIGTTGATVTITAYTLLKKALEPGGLLSDSFLARTNGFATGVFVTFTVGKADQTTGAFVALSTGFTIAPSMITDYRQGVLFGDQIQLDSTLAIGADDNLWLKIDVTISSPFGSPGSVEMDNIMQVRGNQLLSYDFAPSEADDLTGTGTAVTYVGSTAAQVDAGGGGKNPDFSGGEITL